MIASPKEVATYDEKPSMSAEEVTDEVVKRVAMDKYQLIILNFANCDMVGHTGNLAAAIEAMETVDSCLGRVVDAVIQQDGKLLITADHGNCEQMVDENGNPHTAHTTNPVQFIFVDQKHKKMPVRDGILADLAPTILELLNLEKPAAMTGQSLLVS
jgi:2,3-bisphosphoglycerate-independent phosphoglycerate mutase